MKYHSYVYFHFFLFTCLSFIFFATFFLFFSRVLNSFYFEMCFGNFVNSLSLHGLRGNRIIKVRSEIERNLDKQIYLKKKKKQSFPVNISLPFSTKKKEKNIFWKTKKHDIRSSSDTLENEIFVFCLLCFAISFPVHSRYYQYS